MIKPCMCIIAIWLAFLSCCIAQLPGVSLGRRIHQSMSGATQSASQLPGGEVAPTGSVPPAVGQQQVPSTEFPLLSPPNPLVTASSAPATPSTQLQPVNFPLANGSPTGSSFTAVPPSPPQALSSKIGEGQGTLTSFLNPPPGFVMPQLSPAQEANIPKLKQLRQGLATVAYDRSISNYDGVNMNCGMGYLNNYFTAHFVGLPMSLYGKGELCGLCVQIWCVDTVCESPLLANSTFIIADSCQECQGNSIVWSAPGAGQLTGVNYNDNPSVQVAWTFTSCAPYIQGGIKMLPSSNNAKDFLGLNFSNLKVILKAVIVNGISMQYTNYGYWVINTPGNDIPISAPFTLQLLSVNNQQLEVRLAGLVAQDLGVNFNG